MILSMARLILNTKKFGPIEFFMNVMAIEMVAPEFGKHTLKEYFNGERKHFDLPLEIKGTEFQKRVWNEASLS